MTMTPFLLLKVVHILAAIVALGANVTYAFWLRQAGRDPERQSAEAERDPSSEAYAAAALRSNLLGVVTIAIFSLIVVLMVMKPF
jgi:uncharacterized membrane protein